MMENKLKQKSSSKPVISSKLPDAFSRVIVDKIEAKSPVKLEKKHSTKVSKVLKHLDKMPDSNAENLFEPYPNTVAKLPYFPLHLEEMITLSQTSSTSLASTVRKVLHAKSLTLFSIKQIPISNRQERNALRVLIEKWRGFKHSLFVKVLETFWNSPEGCVSIVNEYCNAGSLNDLCKNAGSIPEKPLSLIAKSLMQAALVLKEQGETFVGLSTTHVLFNKEGQIRISPGFTKKIFKEDSEKSCYCIGKILIRAILDEIIEIKVKNCCLLHSIESNPLVSRISPNLQDFLCGLTSYENPKDIEELLSHKWLLQEEFLGPEVDLKEIIAIGFKKEEIWEVGDIQLNRICEALKVILVTKKYARPTTAVIESLAEELDIPHKILFERLSKVYNEILM